MNEVTEICLAVSGIALFILSVLFALKRRHTPSHWDMIKADRARLCAK